MKIEKYIIQIFLFCAALLTTLWNYQFGQMDHVEHLPILFRAANTNTGPCSVNINALLAVPIKGADDSDLVAGQILVGKIYQLVYDGINYQLLNPYITNVVGDALIIDTFDANSEFSGHSFGNLFLRISISSILVSQQAIFSVKRW